VEQNLPACRLISRSLTEIEQIGATVLPHIKRWAQGRAQVEVIPGESQVGSGALPDATLASRLVALTPTKGSPEHLAHELRTLQPPVIGRVSGGKVLLDLRGLLEPDPLIKALEPAEGK
jgi:L-seryl-tRNA(Ser) seleniumtransferase